MEGEEKRKSYKSEGGSGLKVALVGSSGYISDFILKRFAEEPDIDCVLKLDRTGDVDVVLDLAEADRFEYEILDEIEYVVFTAAISRPDQCAEEMDICWNVNVTGTGYFIREAIKRKCRVLFFSSDAVFGDIPGQIYVEESETNACTPYGKMKKAVEDEFKGEKDFKAIRLSYVASAKDRFYTYCLNCIRNGDTADIFHPFYRNAIVASDVVDVVAYFAFHWNEYEPVFLNVAGKELVSRIRMADELNRLTGGKLKYTISMPGEKFFTNRPQITQMKSQYMQKYGILPDNTFTEKIAKEMENIAL